MRRIKLEELDREGIFYVLEKWETDVKPGVQEIHKILVDSETYVMYHTITTLLYSRSLIDNGQPTSVRHSVNTLLNSNGSPRLMAYRHWD